MAWRRMDDKYGGSSQQPDSKAARNDFNNLSQIQSVCSPVAQGLDPLDVYDFLVCR
jgi:hypothetical protein